MGWVRCVVKQIEVGACEGKGLFEGLIAGILNEIKTKG